MLPISWLCSCFLETQILVYLLLFGLAAIAIHTWMRNKHVVLDPRGRAVLITGCDSGFGNQLAHRLLDMGFTVFATCLFPDGEGAQSLITHASPGQVKVIRLDVTSDKEVEQVKQYVLDNLPDKGLWGLVNNSGISGWGMVEWLTIEKYQRVLDVNLLGGIRTTLAFAPLVRKSKGRMVFLSSMSAYVSFVNGIYSLTKAALEKFCDSLRLEMKWFGVKVCIIEPGNFAPATNIHPQANPVKVWDSLPAEAKKIYSKELIEDATNSLNKSLVGGSKNSYEVVDAIVDALTSPTPKARYLVTNFVEKGLVFLYLWLPTLLFDQIISLPTRKYRYRSHND
ncbi:short-chain dehydrogenase/reductase family 9C member 7-like [Bufo gargarizans]|uniref:short-chain dehydrogenase/reductase family 9C member 7-like n=1 Tax=Bufo gargarizans TaxID=30331 RepID=UPI001CF1FB59|nr:short-chain dehydrogenase/reductase family 9C member 7-like [Bufo gargarizans]